MAAPINIAEHQRLRIGQSSSASRFTAGAFGFLPQPKKLRANQQSSATASMIYLRGLTDFGWLLAEFSTEAGSIGGAVGGAASKSRSLSCLLKTKRLSMSAHPEHM